MKSRKRECFVCLKRRVRGQVLKQAGWFGLVGGILVPARKFVCNRCIKDYAL